jgi:pimeloyl-ACP methyl ester carboxylesterase
METMPNDTPLPKQRSSIRKSAFRVLLTLVILYVVFALMVMVFQRRFIYFPTKLAARLAESLAAKEGFRAWRNKGGEIIGWHLPASSPATGTVLIAHGNAGSAFDRSYLAQPIHAASPVDVYVLEYPGYGAREGFPSLPGFLTAAEDAFSMLSTNRPVYIVAESLGAGVAAHLAKTHGSRVSGLLFFAPYDDLAAVGQKQMPFLPVKLLMRDRFTPSKWLKNYRGPLVVVVAGADTIIPPQFGRRLHDGYAGPKKLQEIAAAGHNDIAAQSADWWKEILSFWQTPPAR